MQAEIIVIGDEILIGQTVDTNSTFIATHLNLNGITVKQKRVIADDAPAIIDALDQVLPETTLVFMTGGLGPTKDDITKKTLADYFGGELVFNQDVYDNIVRLFKGFGRTPSPANRDQALLPNTAEVVFNEIGTASGMHFSKDGKHYFSLPGVPYETEYLVEKKIIPWILGNFKMDTLIHKTILTQGVPESELSDMLSDWEQSLPSSLKLAYLPSAGMVKLRLSTYEGDRKVQMRLIDDEVVRLKEVLGNIVFGEDAQTLQEVLGILLKERQMMLSTAESCTGGYIASLVTSVAGSSEYFNGSVVSYSNQAKMDLLGVRQEDLEEYGAVSEAVVEQMARGAMERFGTQCSIATSGVAGPGGGSEEKPVGTVWIAVGLKGDVISKRFHFGKDRRRNIRRSALMALDMLRKELLKIH